MQHGSEKLLQNILQAIKLTKMQEVDDYVATIISKNKKVSVDHTGSMTRCLLLYLLKHKVFEFKQSTEDLKHIHVEISSEKILEIYDVLLLSPELKSLLTSTSEHGMIIISKNPRGLLDIIS